MTTDTTAIQERIARVLNDEGWTFEGVHEPGDYDECEDCRLTVAPIASRIAQGIAAEVQAAKAEALRKIAPHLNDSGDESFLLAAATEYETGDQA